LPAPTRSSRMRFIALQMMSKTTKTLSIEQWRSQRTTAGRVYTSVEDEHPVASIVLLDGEQFKTVQQPLDQSETTRRNSPRYDHFKAASLVGCVVRIRLGRRSND
jgi:hypothetical protein